MRIIAGQFKGRSLRSVPGDETRPTSDRVREALMSSLFSARGTFEGAQVLDAFAGSGALGLEALSRGADRALFVDLSRGACKVVQANIDSLGLAPERASVRACDAFSLAARHQGPFDLVFFDPPYAFEPLRVLGLAQALHDSETLSADALICYEHAKTAAPEVNAACVELEYELVVAKCYGKTSLVIVRKASR